MAYRQSYKKQLVGLDRPKWKRTPLSTETFPKIENNLLAQIHSTDHKIKIKTFESWAESDEYDSAKLIEKTAKNSLGDFFNSYINANFNHGYYIESQQSSFEPPLVKIEYVLNDKQKNLVDNHLIVVGDGVKLDVIIDYKSQGDSKIQHYGITRVIAGKGSSVRIYKVQQLHDQALHYDEIFTKLQEGACVEVLNVEIGGAHKVVSFDSQLVGRQSRSILNNLYYGKSNERVDLSYSMTHLGAKSESEILSKGALDNEAKKVFRGNLYFETGAKQATGKEEEFVILLGKNVHSDSIPSLMCSEDDVVGEHAASVGQLDREKLFYLMTRGFSEIEAKKLVIKASFEEILMTLHDEALKNDIQVALERRLA